jgi:thioredoxin 1
VDPGLDWNAGKPPPMQKTARQSACIWAVRPAPVPDDPEVPFVSKSVRATAHGHNARKTRTMSSELIKHVSDSSFESDVIRSDKPVLVDFWAEWCGPCKGIAPMLDEASKDYDGRLQIAKLNVDENREVPARYNIRGIPTLMLFKGGELVGTKVGALPKAQLTAFIDGHL